jgi:BatD DUF11 like domain
VTVTEPGSTRPGRAHERTASRAGAALVGSSLALLSPAVWAQTTVDLDVAATTVEVGQPFNVQMQALSSDASPESPRLKVPSDFSVEGPSVGSNHQVSFVNGRIQRRTGITATWQLIARRAGVFTLGPASVAAGGSQASSRAVSIKVVPAGTLPARPRRRAGSPFDDDDFFGGLGGFGRRRSLLDEMLGRVPEEEAPAPPPEYTVESAPDPRAFVRAVVHPQHAVVGEQVTLDVYAYGSQGRFRENNPREPRRSDFYSYSLIENSMREPTYVVKVDGTDFYAVRIRRYALFPLKAGELEIGPMELNLYGSGYVSRQAQDGVLRRTLPLTVHVTEPDLETRPLGYQLGDVGEYTLRATVAPRELTVGESLSVTAVLEGVGNVPGHLLTPEQKGVTWREPTVQGEPKQVSDGVIGGTRSFTYVVQLDKPGQIDLGELSLPHWNPKTAQYSVAKVDLGKVTVAPKPAAAGAPPPDEARPPLGSMLTPSTELGRAPAARKSLPAQRWFWWLALGTPVLVVAIQGLQQGLSGVLTRLRRERTSPARQCKEALNEAKSLSQKGELKSAFSAVERALYLAIEARAGVRGRGMVHSELGHALHKAGLDAALCAELIALFEALDLARFAQDTSGAGELVGRAQRAVALLSQKPGSKV